MNEEKQKFIGGIDFDELMSQRIQIYNTLVIDLTSARSNEERTFVGNYLYALEATDIDATLDIRFNQSFRGAIKLVKGRGVRAPFYRFYLTNAAQAGKTITLAIGVESDSFEILDIGKALEITGGVKIAGASGIPVYAQVSVNNTATLIKAVNGNRRSILIQNLDPVNTLFIGYDGSVTTGNAGHEIGVNNSLELNTESAIYGIRAAGSGNAAYLEENNA